MLRCRRRSLGNLHTTLWYALAPSTASSESATAPAAAVRTRSAKKRDASPNHAPAMRSTSLRSPLLGASAGSPASRRLSSASWEQRTRRRPRRTNTTSCMSCPSSTTRSPGRQETKVCTCASSAMKECWTSRKSGNLSTVLRSSSRDSSLCTAGDSRPRRPAADAIWRSCRTRRRRSCSTRSWRSVDTPLRRISWSASWASWSASSWKTR
mmetsp:Transcript_7224/g.19711  ORF Transcript_7224/g.19711 Transcript_7224/m.19711 type:complete len:210 (-) Transcript_7224:531-1160(-)